ncbi:MAG: hypothetical protein JNL01_13295 [Bdellovibrionales bacterium]|nr:hypothetical protein [Bdellovibrionales bacterium]
MVRNFLVGAFVFFLFFNASALAKTAILVPGLFAHPNSVGYDDLTLVLNQKGYDVLILNLRWADARFRFYEQQIHEQLSNIPMDDQTVVIATSIGGFLTLANLHEFQMGRLILVSPAPFFDDIVDGAPYLAWNRAARWYFKLKDEKRLFSEAVAALDGLGIPTTVIYAKHDHFRNRDFAHQLGVQLKNAMILRSSGGHGVRNTQTRNLLISHLNAVL